MALRSELLNPNRRLQQDSENPPSIKPFPSVEDRDAVKRIQEALVQLGYLSSDFGLNLLSGEIFGMFGKTTEAAVKAFQKDEFPTSPNDWDGMVGRGRSAGSMPGSWVMGRPQSPMATVSNRLWTPSQRNTRTPSWIHSPSCQIPGDKVTCWPSG